MALRAIQGKEDALWGRLAACGGLEIRLVGGVTNAAQDAILPHKPAPSSERIISCRAGRAFIMEFNQCPPCW